jgi:hypothetical protein
MVAILLGTLLVVIGLFVRGDFYQSHGPGLGKYGPPIEPRWLPRLLLVAVGVLVILDGISEVRHH